MVLGKVVWPGYDDYLYATRWEMPRHLLAASKRFGKSDLL
jgi:hypothetical protein